MDNNFLLHFHYIKGSQRYWNSVQTVYSISSNVCLYDTFCKPILDLTYLFRFELANLSGVIWLKWIASNRVLNNLVGENYRLYIVIFNSRQQHEVRCRIKMWLISLQHVFLIVICYSIWMSLQMNVVHGYKYVRYFKHTPAPKQCLCYSMDKRRMESCFGGIYFNDILMYLAALTAGIRLNGSQFGSELFAVKLVTIINQTQ